MRKIYKYDSELFCDWVVGWSNGFAYSGWRLREDKRKLFGEIREGIVRGSCNLFSLLQ